MGTIVDVNTLKNFLESGNIPNWDDFNKNNINDDQIQIMINTLNEFKDKLTAQDKINNISTLTSNLNKMLPTTQVPSSAPITSLNNAATALPNNTTPSSATPVDVEVQVSKSGENICVGLSKEAKDTINAMKGGKRSRSKNAKSKSKSTQKKNKKGSKRQGKYKKNGGRSNKNNQ